MHIPQMVAFVALPAAFVGMMAFVRLIQPHMKDQKELPRKIVHISMALFCLLLPWLFKDVKILLATLFVIMFFLFVFRFFKNSAGSVLHSIERKSYGDLLLGPGIVITLILSNWNLELYIIPVLILAIADPMAAIFGKLSRKYFYSTLEKPKTFTGSFSFFLSAFLCSSIGLFVLDKTHSIFEILSASYIVALVASVTEAASFLGFDNLLIPIVSYFVLSVVLFDLKGNQIYFEALIVSVLFVVGNIATGRKHFIYSVFLAILLGYYLVHLAINY